MLLLENIFIKHGVGLKVAAFSGRDVIAQYGETLLKMAFFKSNLGKQNKKPCRWPEPQELL